MYCNVDTYVLTPSTTNNEGELLQGLPDTSNENIPGDPKSQWLLVSCLEVGYHFPEGGNNEDPQSRWPFGLILAPAVGCRYGFRDYFDKEAATHSSPDTVFRRVGVFASKDLKTSKTMSFEGCPNEEITII